MRLFFSTVGALALFAGFIFLLALMAERHERRKRRIGR